ncbi:MAG TPA: DNA-protecting protein DprA [Clostridiaceae bacterium]|nr:DNA-protecting protein DprA [Clostridiaceae bacterium]
MKIKLAAAEILSRAAIEHRLSHKRRLGILRATGSLTKLWEYLAGGQTTSELPAMDILRFCWNQTDTEKLLSEAGIWASQGIKVISALEEEFPSRLAQRGIYLSLLYYRGPDPTLLGRKAVAVVGSRALGPYGKAATMSLTDNLCRRGYVIVSGAATGADSVAHRQALATGRETIAVLGCGVDRAYPRAQKQLLQEISETGLVISEYRPGTPPLARNFPARNRIIAALAEAVLVVSARKKSGSLITAHLAHKMGIPVFAVPGSVFSHEQEGCHYLIKEKIATIITDLEAPGLSGLGGNEVIKAETSQLITQTRVPGQIPATVSDPADRSPSVAADPTQKLILEQLSLRPLTMAQIACLIDKPLSDTAQILTQMELARLLLNRRGQYELNRFRS